MINKTFSKILTLGLSIVLITSVLTTFVFYKNYEQQEKKKFTVNGADSSLRNG